MMDAAKMVMDSQAHLIAPWRVVLAVAELLRTMMKM